MTKATETKVRVSGTSIGEIYTARFSNSVVWAIYEPYLNIDCAYFIFNEKSNEKDSLYSLNSDGTATIPIKGTILKTEEDAWWRNETSQEYIKNAIDTAIADESVKNIVLAIDSPGGVAQGIQELAEHIVSARNIKPISASVDGMCCSAAYWLASATDTIQSTASSMIGSIGVIYTHYDTTKMYENEGVFRTYITAGKYKAVGAPKKLTDSDKEIIQESVNHIYENFTSAVAKNRHLSIDNIDTWADGRVFFGDQAKEIGLVSRITKNQIPHTVDTRSVPMAEKNQNETPQADVQKQIAEAVASREDAILAIANVVLGEENGNKLAQALATGMTAEQMSSAKKFFAVEQQKEETKKDDNVNATVEQRLKEILSSMLEGAKPATTVNTENLEKSERLAFLERAGNYGKETK